MKKELGLWGKLLASLDNTTDGFSARKLSALTGVIVAIITTMKFVDEKVVISAIEVWLVFALLCLGIITAQQVLQFTKRGGDGDGDKKVDELNAGAADAPKQ